MHFIEFRQADRPEPRTDASLLGVLETKFRALSAADMVLDLQHIGHRRQIIAQIRLVRQVLADPRTSYPDRDILWRDIVTFANYYRNDWHLAAVGMAMPGLRNAERTKLRPEPDERDDVQADLVTGFLRRLPTVDLRRRNICGRLIAAGIRAAILGREQRRMHAAYTENSTNGIPIIQQPLPSPDDTVELIATWAEFNRLPLHPDERLLIQMTRLQGADLATAARRLGISVSAATERRRRAEHRLARHYQQTGKLNP